ncbi:hypothetical protein C1S80_29445 [Mycolicibacterium aubagnense]|nr:hypothetical protein C1S80_29445 [Mycolicibacterium aubagnense]
MGIGGGVYVAVTVTVVADGAGPAAGHADAGGGGGGSPSGSAEDGAPVAITAVTSAHPTRSNLNNPNLVVDRRMAVSCARAGVFTAFPLAGLGTSVARQSY